MDTRKIAEDNLFFYTVTGSRAYGMATEHSDTDYRGLFYVPKDFYMSVFKNVEQVERFGDKKDSIVYEVSKYIKLLTEQNPNILELLWVEKEFVIQKSPLYEILRSNREVFLSSKAKHTFSGYAMTQLKRIKGHNKWINNPQPKRRPKEIDFVSVVWNGTDNKRLNKEVPFFNRKAYELGHDIIALIDSQEDKYWYDRHEALITEPFSQCPENEKQGVSLIVKFNRQLYKDHVDNWKNYWEWKDNRNEARAKLEEAHGYDTKHASHLIRLFRMGIEILKGEGVKVARPDASELLAIRNGSLTYEQLMKYVEDLNSEIESAYATTKLPVNVDEEMADELLKEIYNMGWNYDSRDYDLKASEGIGYKNTKV